MISKYLNVNEAWLIGYDCGMDKFNPMIDKIKLHLYSAIEEMDEKQLEKTANFIDEYILKN